MRYLFIAIIVFLLPATMSLDTPTTSPVIPLKILDYPLYAEVAYTSATRSKGLMHRSQLAENNGMLFVFPNAGVYSMWMLNTPIPLSVAFLDEHGIIINMADMDPLSTTLHFSAKPAKFALEMNLGWFAEREIKVGNQICGLEQAPEAK